MSKIIMLTIHGTTCGLMVLLTGLAWGYSAEEVGMPAIVAMNVVIWLKCMEASK